MIGAKDISDLFGLKNVSVRNGELICSCPFTENHRRGDARPSFGINLDKGVYHCLGCGESGNLIQLAQRLLGKSYVEANQLLNPDLTVDSALAMMERHYDGVKQLTPMECDVAKWAANKHEYWHYRGLNDQTIGKWQLGYDPAENRVTVPVYFDKMLLGWSKRAVDDKTMPKWKHSPNLPRNQILFGADNFKDESVILVEAPLSAIALDQMGYHNAVASFGCVLSDEQAVLLRSRYNRLLMFYDPDEAGMKGTRAAVKKLSPYMDVYVIGQTRDDPAAITEVEVADAMERIVPAWAI